MFRKILIAASVFALLGLGRPALAGFGAISLSPSTGICGASWNCGTREEAEQTALDSLTDSDKRISSWCQNCWCTVAESEDKKHWVGVHADSREAAESKAISVCEQKFSGKARAVMTVFSGTDEVDGYCIMGVTTDELSNFYAMFGDADLDADSLAILYQSWEQASHQERQDQYDNFTAKIKEIEEAEAYVEIRIVNPAATGAPWSFLYDGQTQTLAAGASKEFNRKGVIEFTRGNGAATAQYSLAEGVYALASKPDGTWDIEKKDNDYDPDAKPSEPVTDEEQNLFKEMYADAGLDSDTLETLRQSWASTTSADRKAQHDDFVAKVKEAVEAVTPHEIHISNPAANKVAWSFLIDGHNYTLEAGQSRELHAKCVISMNLGGPAGAVEYSLSDGDYAFQPEGDHWKFAQVAPAAEGSDVAADPLTAEDEKTFKEMYADAGLDAETLQAVTNGWKNSTAAERKRQYQEFVAQVKSAVDSATPVSIRIINPASNGVAWSYLLDDKQQTLAAGETRELKSKATLNCDLGGANGAAKIALEEGDYTFAPSGDHWELRHGDEPTAKTTTPVTAAERKIFDRMYAEAGLDADTMKLVSDAWAASSPSERKQQYDKFMAKLSDATASAEKSAAVETGAAGDDPGDSKTTPRDAGATAGADSSSIPPATTYPISADEKKMFDAMYADVGLDAETMKLVREAWAGSTSAQRKSQYDDFSAKVAEAVKAAEAQVAPGNVEPKPAKPADSK